ncbi:MAG: hypothetical protein KGZ92_04070 [Firmicutes bacterium]|nr:hypothetical protein [Dethiobacter sp.]MBS3888464.1 hypothetical protein [Bacillota bacterium]
MWLMAVFTFKEALRKRVVLVAGLLTLAFLTLYGAGLHFMVGGDARITDPAAAEIFKALGPFGSHSTPSYRMLLYTAGYIVVMRMAAVHAFNRRDV